MFSKAIILISIRNLVNGSQTDIIDHGICINKLQNISFNIMTQTKADPLSVGMMSKR